MRSDDKIKYALFPFLKVTNSTWSFKIMTCAVNSPSSGCCEATGILGLC